LLLRLHRVSPYAVPIILTMNLTTYKY
jgi:hypothetical protein